MIRYLLITLGLLTTFMAMPGTVVAQTCNGRFINPITDICWDCAFPITIGGAQIVGASTPDTPNPGSPICFCGRPIPRSGVSVGFWEPVRLIDISRGPGCFSNLGGLEINLGNQARGDRFLKRQRQSDTHARALLPLSHLVTS